MPRSQPTGEITVRAETACLGLRPGDKTTVPDTDFVRRVIAGGRLSVVPEPQAADLDQQDGETRGQRTGDDQPG